MRARLAAAMILIAAALPGLAQDEEEQPQGHPLMVLRAQYNHDSTSGGRAQKGTCSVWLKNMTDVTVDGVVVTLKLVEGSRVVQTLEKKVGTLDAGRKSYLDYEWEDYQGRKLMPQIWVTYNGTGSKAATFRAEPPVW